MPVDTAGLKALFDAWFVRVAQRAADDVVEQLRAYLAPQRKTGELEAGISAEVTSNGAGFDITFRSAAPYSSFVSEGRGPVEAVNAKALHFQIDGRDIFVKSVGPAIGNDFWLLIPDVLPAAVANAVASEPLR